MGAPLFSLFGGGGDIRPLTVGPLLAGLPQRIPTTAKLTARVDLLADQVGLFRGEEARMRLAFHRRREAEVRTVASLGVSGTSAPWFAALDHSFGSGAAAHRPGVGQLGRESAHRRRHIGGSSNGHTLSYGIYSRTNNPKNPALRNNCILVTCTHSQEMH